MKQFSGFPARMQFTPVPGLFFTQLLPEIEDPVELKVTLFIFHLIYSKRASLHFTSRADLLGSAGLMCSLKSNRETPEAALDRALELAVKRGTILELAVKKDGAKHLLYLLNSAADYQMVQKIISGKISLEGLKVEPSATIPEAQPDIYTLYEENIGMLTPMIAEELKSAEALYPAAWIVEATRLAVKLNKRKWSYIAAILERWSTEGKDDGTAQGNSKKTDPDKYVKGKYGHLVQR
jgi:DNA replication protein